MTGEARPRVVIVGGGFAGLFATRANRFGALASWWFAFTRDLRRERTFTSRDVGAVRDVYGEDVATMIAATKTAGPPAPPDPAGSTGPGKPARDRQ
jgi:hypothetical protein